MVKKVEIEEDVDHLEVEMVLDSEAEPLDEEDWDDEDFDEERSEEADAEDGHEES